MNFEEVKKYVKDSLKICTVVGFPNGYNHKSVKIFETAKALECGADEIDMVINIGLLKEKKYLEVASEITEIKNDCSIEDKILLCIVLANKY